MGSLTAQLNRPNGLPPVLATAVRGVLFDIIGAFAAAKDNLDRLDKIASQGALGSRLAAIFQSLSERMRYCDDDKLDQALFAFAKSFNVIGGRAGHILSDWIGRIATGLTDINPDAPLRPQVAELLYLTMEAARFKWRLKVEDKSFFTVFCPFIKVLYTYADQPLDVLALKLAQTAQHAFIQSRTLRARVGHANYLGRRSVGLVDAGAYAAYVCVFAYCQRHLSHD